MQLWKGRFKKELSKTTNDFNSSISFDSRMFREDIEGSIAHATMLGQCGIIKEEGAEHIRQGLREILGDIESGKLAIDMEAEDIHTFIEGELTKRIGDDGKRLHTSRSRNDQVALDIKLYLKKEVVNTRKMLEDLIAVIAKKAKEYSDTVMPGYTHLQRAQPITFGHHLLAYAEMFLRDISRLDDCLRRMAALSSRRCSQSLWSTSAVSPRKSLCGAPGNSSSSSSTTLSRQARQLCRRKRTPTSRSSFAARADAYSVTR